MGTLDDLPQRPDSHDMESDSILALEERINPDLFVIQGKDRNDYGTDVHIELRSGISMTNLRFQVQLKGVSAPAESAAPVSVSVCRHNLNYLLRQPNSLYVCWHSATRRLLVRYAHDVYSEYEHKSQDWQNQSSITVRFRRPFDQMFQQQHHALVLESGTLHRDQRLRWSTSPPEQVSDNIQKIVPDIVVPSEPVKASKMLEALYQSGNDLVISKHFQRFAALLPSELECLYFAEINLGINGHEFSASRVEEAIDWLRAKVANVERDPVSEATVLYNVGNAYSVLGKYDDACAFYKDSLTVVGTHDNRLAAQCTMNYGSVLEKLGKHDAALSFYERAVSLESNLGEARLALALLYRKANNLNESLKHIRLVVSSCGSAIDTASARGWEAELLFRLEHFEEAFQVLNGLESDAERLSWPWPWAAQLVSTYSAGQIGLPLACRFWDRYLYRFPDDNTAKRQRLLCFAEIKMAGEQVSLTYEEFKSQCLPLIHDNDPCSPLLWDRVGHWAQMDKDWEEAADAYHKAYDTEPEQFAYCYGTSLNFLKKFELAHPILVSHAESCDADSMSWFQVAVAKEGIGDISGAVSAYDRAIELDSGYAKAWFNKGGVLWNAGKRTSAAKTWIAAIARFPEDQLAEKARQILRDVISPQS